MSRIFHALVCCRAGMGSSTLLKIKADQVIKQNHYPIVTEHGTMDDLYHYDGDLIITMCDLSEQLKGKVPYVIGVHSIVDQNEIRQQLRLFLESENLDPSEFEKRLF